MSWPRTVAFLMLLAAPACSDDEPTGATQDGQENGIPVTLVDQPGGDAVLDPFTLLEAEIDGDTLRMQVGYGGGCRAHTFGLEISGNFMESDPVQTRAALWHDSADDPCEAFILTWLEADLVPLKNAWQAAYQAENGTIVLHLAVPASEAECDATPFAEPGSCSLFYSF